MYVTLTSDAKLQKNKVCEFGLLPDIVKANHLSRAAIGKSQIGWQLLIYFGDILASGKRKGI